MKPHKLGDRSAAPYSWRRLLVLLTIVLLALFWKVGLPGQILFSNDGPLGASSAQAMAMPSAFFGVWQDLNSLGNYGGNFFLPVTGTLLWLMGPLFFAKLYTPFALLLLGCSAGLFFHQLRLAPVVCIIGGLAAALNSAFFSTACWGIAGYSVALAMSFIALATILGRQAWWIRLPLAGLSVGVGVMEAADVGGIFSVCVAAFVFCQALAEKGPGPAGMFRGIGQVSLVAVFAVFVAGHSLAALISTQIKGIAGAQQDTQTKKQRWDFATQWSLPKREALRFVVPGLFGYRMDTPDGGAYWGMVGRDPDWERYFGNGKQGQPPAGPIRFSGSGIYAGVLVALVAFWAALQSFRKSDSVFSLGTRRWIWFWLAVSAGALLLAFGRFAPFYRLLYALPYVSTIRNPTKFCYVVNWGLVVLFAYGVHGLWQRYMETPSHWAKSNESVKTWWRRVRGFDRLWTAGCVAVFGASVVGWFLYASTHHAFERYLQEVQFDADTARGIARFSLMQAGWFILSLAVASVWLILVLSGAFRGPRAKWGPTLLGLLLAVDLGRANQPWIITWDHRQKYASNPIIDLLRQKPYEHRVTGLPRWLLQPRLLQAFHLSSQATQVQQYFSQEIYGNEWAQHHFLFYNIQSLDIIQMARVPEDLLAFDTALSLRIGADVSRVVARRLELTNTRYLLGATDFLDILNQQFDPVQQRFRIAERFHIAPKAGIAQPTKLEELTALFDTIGPLALFEFTGALPRTKLYSNWEVNTNHQAVLEQVAGPSFDPQKSVLVSSGLPSSVASADTNQNPGTAELTSYAPKDIVIKAEATVPSVLLLNDRYDANWKVFVDGKQEPLLRCNYIMRGVHLTPGPHKVEFRFQPPTYTFYVSVAAMGVGLFLCGLLLLQKTRPRGARVV